MNSNSQCKTKKKNYKIYSYINKEPQLMAVKMESRGRERKLSYAKHIKKIIKKRRICHEWHKIYARIIKLSVITITFLNCIKKSLIKLYFLLRS